MKSSTTPRFWKAYRELPAEVRATARRQFRRWLENPDHPSLHFKPVGPFWSARVGLGYRALALKRGDTYHWFWIGTHADYDKILSESD